jgi:SAM-dependent methyltransferase
MKPTPAQGPFAVHAPEQASVAENRLWFQDNDHYIQSQCQLECYQHIQKIVEREVRGTEHVLDIGNGGFFNYDTALAGHVTAVDLFLEDGPGSTPNSTFRQGSFLDIPFADGSFDCVLQQNVFHHVTGRTVAQNHANLRQCLSEMARCLCPGGKAVVIESTVGPLFNAFEWLVYRPALFLKRGGHPITFQYTPHQLIRAAQDCGLRLEEFTYVPRGWFILQFGVRWPSCLTPARPVKLIFRR